MSRKVQTVDISFKNGDCIQLPSSAFTFFSAQIIPFSDPSVNILSFILKTDTNQNLESFPGNCCSTMPGDDSLFSRLMYRDIAVVTLLREDESRNVYPVVWQNDDDDENRNCLQYSYTNKGGQLCLQITPHPVQAE